jgi:hypothetical protein
MKSEHRAEQSEQIFRWPWEKAIREDYRIPQYAMGTILLMAQWATTKTGGDLYVSVAEVARIRHCDADTLGDHIKIAVELGWFVNEGRIKKRNSNTYHLAIPANRPVYVRKDAMAEEAAARKARTDKIERKPLVAVDISPRFAGWDPAAAAAVRKRESMDRGEQ